MLKKFVNLVFGSGSSESSQLLGEILLGDNDEEAAADWVALAKANGGFTDQEWNNLSEREQVRAINRVTDLPD